MMGLVPLGLFITAAVTPMTPMTTVTSSNPMTITSASVSATAIGSTAPAPTVIAWSSFLNADDFSITPIDTAVQWSSGEAWNPLVGTWAQVDGTAVATRSSANARAVATIPSAASSARVVVRVTSRDNSSVHSGGVVAAAGTTGTRIALAAVINADGSLEIRRVSGGGAAVVVIANSGNSVLLASAVEISLQVLDGVAIATARSLSADDPEVTLAGTLTARQSTEVSGNSAYGLYAPLTTNVSFTALRVEWPA